MQEILERETKWDVDDTFTVPPLDDLIPGGRVTHDTVELTSTYYDTADHDLQAVGLRLRRRTGDTDTGWQLKIPTGDGHTELHAALTEELPTELGDLLAGASLSKPLSAVATIRTTRHRYRIREPQTQEPFAELVDDHVRASAGHQLLAWREIEVELAPGTDTVPRRLTKRLGASGARPASHDSKLAHVLAPVSVPDDATAAYRSTVAYLNAQIEQIVLGDVDLRRGRDPIHDTRVAIRRLRSTLRVFGPLLPSDALGGIDAELRWWASLLGEVRDCQVQRRRFGDALDELPDDLVLGPVRAEIASEFAAIEASARDEVTAALTSARYLGLLTVLRTWLGDPPVPQDLAARELRRRTRRAHHKAHRRLSAAVESVPDDTVLHRARKGAKRARYAAELTAPLTTTRTAKRNIKRYKTIQSILGDHQDAVVAKTVLRRLGAAMSGSTDRNGFTYGLLYAREERIMQGSRRDAAELL